MCQSCEERKIEEKRTKACKICGEEKPVKEFPDAGKGFYKNKCKLCEWFEKRPNLSEFKLCDFEELKIIIDNLLNRKVGCINDILPFIPNIDFQKLIKILDELKLNSIKAQIRYKCEYCGKTNYTILAKYKMREHLFCDKLCYDKWQNQHVIRICKQCGKEFNTMLDGQEFCSRNCWNKYRSTIVLETRHCMNCGEEFICKKVSTQKFCSVSCNTKYYGALKERNTTKVKCFCCGEMFFKDTYKIDKSKRHFCSVRCFRKWYDEVYSKTEEFSDEKREITLHALEEGKFKHTDTEPQLKINKLLEYMNVWYENEYVCGNFAIDNFLGTNLYIEVMGGYWHCDNRIYDSINYEGQVDRIYRDKAKHSYFYNNMKSEILYLWEEDINNNLELCETLIERYIVSNGKLDNYHSMNYTIKDNLLCLNDNIIMPYMYWHKNDLNEIIDTSIKISKDYYITFQCDHCKKETIQLISDYEINKNHFCSNECKHLFRTLPKPNNCICSNCGKEIYLSPSVQKDKKHLFCDRKCYLEYQKNGGFRKIK